MLDDGLARENVEQLRPDVTAERLGFDGREHGGHVVFFGNFGQQRCVVDQCRTVCVGHAEEHLRLLVNKHDGRIRRCVEFLVTDSYYFYPFCGFIVFS